MQLVYLGAALGGGVLLAGAALWAARRYAKTAKPSEEAPIELEPLRDEDLFAEEHPATFVAPVPAPARAPAPPPPPASPRAHTERAPAMILTRGVEMQDSSFDRRPMRAAPPAPAPPPRRAPPPPRSEPPARAQARPAPPKTWAQQAMEQSPAPIPSEWARRQVGPVEPGRTAGACGGCGARLSVSDQRPLRIACPVCGRSKLLAA